MTNTIRIPSKYDAIKYWQDRVTWAATSKSLAVIDSNSRVAIEMADKLTSQYEFNPEAATLIQQVVDNLNFVRDNILVLTTKDAYQIRARLSNARWWAQDARLFA